MSAVIVQNLRTVNGVWFALSGPYPLKGGTGGSLTSMRCSMAPVKETQLIDWTPPIFLVSSKYVSHSRMLQNWLLRC